MSQNNLANFQENIANNSIIAAFCKHKVAANIVMILMLMSGVWAILQLNTQFLPNFKLEVVTISVVWPGASAEDVEQAVTIPIEQELKGLNHVKEISSVSRESIASIRIEFQEGSDISQALDEVKQQVALVKNLPNDSEPPEVLKVVRFENIARVILSGPDNLEQLRPIAYEFKRQLLDYGIAKINIAGLPEKEIAIQIPSENIFAMQQSLPQIADQILQASQTLPVGTAGEDALGHAIRSPGKLKSPYEFGKITLDTKQQQRIQVNQIADIIERPQKNEVLLEYEGKPAVELTLLRTETADSLASAKILDDWLEQVKPIVGDSLNIIVFDESWRPIDERITLLVKNGVGGLALILIILFLFLEKRIAFWIAFGIPASFAASLFILYLLGGSINMVSLFALIMTLGIIVDDTIVVGENAFARMEKGEHPTNAAIKGAQNMLAPIIASSLTTIAAFVPLMLIGGIIGNILFDIPLVVICVISMSLIECFFVLPGHISHSYSKSAKKIKQKEAKFFKRPGDLLNRARNFVDEKFNQFKDNQFRCALKWSIKHKWSSISIAISFFLVVISLLTTNRIGYQFFPTPDSNIVKAHIQFIAGTPQKTVYDFLNQVNTALNQVQQDILQETEQDIIRSAVTYQNQGSASRDDPNRASHVGSIVIELTSPDSREVSNQQFIEKWRAKITTPPGLEKFLIFSQRGGPPGKDIDIDLIGTDTKQLKEAAIDLQNKISVYPGVFNLQDNLPYGKPELIYELLPQAETLGVTVQSLGRQLRAAFDGSIVQIINIAEDDIEVRVILPDAEKDNLATLRFFPILTPQGNMVPLSTIAKFKEHKGLASIRHIDGLLTVRISAEVNPNIGNAQEIINELLETAIPEVVEKHGIRYKLKGKSEDQKDTFEDMGRGVILAVGLIYLILAFVFASYTWPLTVMAIIPFGVAGGILGHYIMNVDLTLLSFFGFFGLSGIVVNDSIILVTLYRKLRESKMRMKDAIIEASSQRLRAVLLTSLTTIAGLTPLLFETSVQAQFLIPMAVSISFGLAFATVLVLFLVPILLYMEEQLLIRWRWVKRRAKFI